MSQPASTWACCHVYQDGSRCTREKGRTGTRFACSLHQKRYAVVSGAPVKRAYQYRGAWDKRQVRLRKKARGLGFSEVPMWLHNKHPEGCPCYDCLWGDPPTNPKWNEKQPTAYQPKMGVFRGE